MKKMGPSPPAHRWYGRRIGRQFTHLTEASSMMDAGGFV